MQSEKLNLIRPKIGEPCNGCGSCCKIQVCSTGSFTMRMVGSFGQRADGPCPALVQQNGVFACNLVLQPKYYAWGKGSAHELRNAVKVLIGTGVGCDEHDPDDDKSDEKLRQIQHDYMSKHKDDIHSAVKMWFGHDQ